MKKSKIIKGYLWTVSLLSFSVFILTLTSSCQKESVGPNDNQTNKEFVQKEETLPPYREFECGPPDPTSPYECPNASCDYLGWDCLFEIQILSLDDAGYNKYVQAANLLQEHITDSNTAVFFINHSDEVSILMPELALPLDVIGQAMLDDLKNGITSVKMHPVFHAESERKLYIIQVYVIETGGPPNYSHLL
jgi:hypothetical protein